MKNKKNIIITILSIAIIILIGYMFFDKLILSSKTKENNLNNTQENSTPNEEEVNNQEESTNKDDNNNSSNSNDINKIFSNLVGEYKYGHYGSNCNDEFAGKGYTSLKLNSNGTYTYNYGMNCGSGYYAEGDYSITNNQIYLLNYKCPACLTCDNEYNCSPIIILT